MVDRLDSNLNDPVEGPEILENPEQARVRSTRVHEEHEEDLAARSSDSGIPTMEQNLLGNGGVDDRGAEDRDR
jgi:hypothetical protein